jgi:hypothetical protein
MRGLIEIAMVAAMATWLLYPLVWEIVFHVWPAACVAPDGSILLCLIDETYTRPRDLTAVAVSIAMGLTAAAFLHLLAQQASRRNRPTAPVTAAN